MVGVEAPTALSNRRRCETQLVAAFEDGTNLEKDAYQVID